MILFLFLGLPGLIQLAPLLFNSREIGNFGDLYSYYYPLRHLAASSLQAGHLPLWNPYIFSGTPFLANPQTSLFYPPNILFAFFPFRPAFSLMALFHLWGAALGCYLCLKKLKISSGPALLAALGFSMSRWMMARISQGVPTLFYGFGWMPWVLLFLAAKKPAGLQCLGLILALAFLFLSGHLQTTLVGLVLISSLWLLRPQTIKTSLAAGIFSIGLVALQFLPALEFLNLSNRAFWTIKESLAYSLAPAHLLTIFQPNLFGHPETGNLSWPGLPSVFFEQMTLYPGWLITGFGLAGLFWTLKRRRYFWSVTFFLSLFISLGEHNPILVKGLEAIGKAPSLRAPARFAGAALLCLAMASAYALEGVSKILPKRFCILAFLWLALMADLLWHNAPFIFTEPSVRFLSTLGAQSIPSHHDPAKAFRVLTDASLPNPNKAMLYHHFNVAGYEAFYLKNMTAYAYASEGQPVADTVRLNLKTYNTPAMAALGVRYFLTTEPIPGGNPFFHANGLWVYQNPKALPLVYALSENRQEDPAIIDLQPEHWWLKPKAPGQWVVASIPIFPGWQAFQSGKRVPIHKTNILYQSVRTETSETLHFLLRPYSFFMGLSLSLLTLLSLLLWTTKAVKKILTSYAPCPILPRESDRRLTS